MSIEKYISLTDYSPEHLEQLRDFGRKSRPVAFYDARDRSILDQWNGMIAQIEELQQRLSASQLRSIEARNPGIDMGSVISRRNCPWDVNNPFYPEGNNEDMKDE